MQIDFSRKCLKATEHEQQYFCALTDYKDELHLSQFIGVKGFASIVFRPKKG
jgi:hypothetical protein